MNRADSVASIDMYNVRKLAGCCVEAVDTYRLLRFHGDGARGQLCLRHFARECRVLLSSFVRRYSDIYARIGSRPLGAYIPFLDRCWCRRFQSVLHCYSFRRFYYIAGDARNRLHFQVL